MKLFIKRAVAASIPLALLAGSTFAAGAAQFGGLQPMFRPFGIGIAATGPAVLGGGGATLPVPAYLGKSVAGKYEGSGVTSFGVVGSILGYFRDANRRAERGILRDRKRQGQGRFRWTGKHGPHPVRERGEPERDDVRF
jgi:hypothetical protein